MISLAAGAILLSIIHAAIPNHWMPMIVLSRSEKWHERETLAVTALSGFAHTASTVLIGIIVGIVGWKLSETFHIFSKLVAPTVLLLLGIVFIVLDLRDNHHHHHHDHSIETKNKKNKTAIVTSLFIAMFFSPCLELEAYYLSAASFGWGGITMVSIIYIVITVLGMMTLVLLGLRGVKKLHWHWLEHHNRLVTGLTLAILGVLAYFVEV